MSTNFLRYKRQYSIICKLFSYSVDNITGGSTVAYLEYREGNNTYGNLITTDKTKLIEAFDEYRAEDPVTPAF